MVAAPFDYVSVSRYEEAVAALVEHGDEAKLIAGGQSLVPMMNLRLVRPSVLVDLNAIPSRPIASEGRTLTLPGLTRHRSLLEDPVVSRHCPLLAEATRHVGNIRVRSRGTIGGSLAHGDPTSEIGASAVVLDAQIVVQGPGGLRRIPVRQLFVSYLTTTLDPTEVITEVVVPAAPPRAGWGFAEMVRRSSDLAIVAVATQVALEQEADIVASVDVALAGVSDKVLLVEPALTAPLLGATGGDAVLATVGAAIAESLSPDSDVHASGDYRRRLVEVLTRRALGDALARGGAAGASERPLR
jgi:carbon-monoxide dehydrogenase medium subunit